MIGASNKESSPRRRVLPGWRIAIVAVAVIMVAAWVYAAARTPIKVQMVHLDYGDIRSEVTTTGTVTPANDFPARANFSGEVERIFVRLQEKVKPGQLLIRMKDQYAIPRLGAARSALDSSEMNLENVEMNGSQEERITFASDLSRAQAEEEQASHALNIAEQLQKSGAVTQAELEAATTRLENAHANLNALRERQTHRYSALDVQSWKDRVAADRAKLAAEKISYGNANITAPIAGTVYSVAANQYDYVSAGADLLHVADLSNIVVRADFEEPDMARLNVGQPIEITWDGKPGRVWHGALASKPLAVIRSADHSVGKCILALHDDNGDLPLDSRVVVAVIVAEHRNALILPREALRTEGGRHSVFQVDNGRVVETPVEIGLVNAMSAEIVRGLSAKEAVVLRSVNGEKLITGLRVSTER